jgi:hypothetical protein
MKNSIVKIISVAILILGPIIAFAQPGPATPSPIPPPDFGPGGPVNCSAPIGNGYWILLSLAVIYGIYKFWELRKAEKTA